MSKKTKITKTDFARSLGIEVVNLTNNKLPNKLMGFVLGCPVVMESIDHKQCPCCEQQTTDHLIINDGEYETLYCVGCDTAVLGNGRLLFNDDGGCPITIKSTHRKTQ